MKKILVLIFMTLVISSIAQVVPQKSVDMRLYGKVERFNWTEYLDGAELLKESGALFGVSFEASSKLNQSLLLEGRSDLFFGDVEYDGSIMHIDGDDYWEEEYTSDTSYTGIKAEADLAVTLPVRDGISMFPLLGFGFRFWQRRLDSSLSDDTLGQYGYTEDWLLVYAVLGLRGEVQLSERRMLTGRLCAKIPLNNEVEYDFSNINGPSSVTVKPGKEFTLYADVGIDISRFTAVLYYEQIEVSDSDVVYGWMQPESQAEITGISLGMIF